MFLNMFLMIQLANNYILLHRAITKSNSFFIKGNSAVSFLHVVINTSKIDSFELFSAVV